MANFQFWGYRSIFWRGHRCKKNSGLFAYAIVKPTRNGLATPKRKFSYIIINGLMGNFQFRGCRTIFWRGHRCKKNSGPFGYAIAKSPRSALVTPKRKFSYIIINGLMANFQFRGCRIIFWRGHRCKKNSWDFYLHLWPLQNMVLQPWNWKFAINPLMNI